jgi:transcription antitermination protein NusB
MKQISRKLSRKILFQKLYAQCFYDNNELLFKETFIDGDIHANEIDSEYVEKMFRIIQTHEANCIAIIERFAPKFEIHKMHISYVIPLYIGICEILYYPEEIPLKVSINEAIEITKIFSDDSGKKIVN